jgi:hypothetical protein
MDRGGSDWNDGGSAVKCTSDLYRPRFLRHRIEAYTASAADGSWLCRTAFGV